MSLGWYVGALVLEASYDGRWSLRDRFDSFPPDIDALDDARDALAWTLAADVRRADRDERQRAQLELARCCEHPYCAPCSAVRARARQAAIFDDLGAVG